MVDVVAKSIVLWTKELTAETFVVKTVFVTSRVTTEVEPTREVKKKSTVVDSV